MLRGIGTGWHRCRLSLGLGVAVVLVGLASTPGKAGAEAVAGARGNASLEALSDR